MLAAFIVRFRLPSGVPLSEVGGFRMAAAFLEAIERYDPDLSASLHADKPWPHRIKPYTVSPAGREAGREGDEGRLAEFRITLLRGWLVGPVISALTQHAGSFHVAGHVCPIEHIDFDPRRQPWSGHIDPATLWELAPADLTASILLATATAFRATDGSASGYVGVPDPRLLIGSLRTRWQAYVDIPLDPRTLDRLRDHLAIARADITDDAVVVKGRRFDGFRGRIDLLAPDPETARSMNALLALSFYSGVGIRTADGMGQAMPLQ